MKNIPDPCVSVIIPAYNYAKFIPVAIESVLHQTYGNIEIIIINDGSRDNTDEVVSKYLHDRRIQYIKQSNSGQTVTKNNGIRMSRGEYVAFLDADDWWDITKLEKQISAFTSDDIGVVYSRSSVVSEDGKSLNWIYPDNLHSGVITAHLFVDNFIPFSSALIRKECIDRIGMFDEGLKMGIDWDLWLRISVDYRFSAVDEPLLFYRMGHENQMSKNSTLRMESSDRIMMKFLGDHPGVLTKREIDRAWAFTYCNRGDFYRKTEWIKSCHYFMKALSKAPGNPLIYKKMIKNILFSFGIMADR